MKLASLVCGLCDQFFSRLASHAQIGLTSKSALLIAFNCLAWEMEMVCVNSRFIEGVNIKLWNELWAMLGNSEFDFIIILSFSCATSHSKGFLCWKESKKSLFGCLQLYLYNLYTHIYLNFVSPFRKAWVSKPKETKDWQTEVGQGGENALICPELIHSTRLFATIQKFSTLVVWRGGFTSPFFSRLMDGYSNNSE